MYACSVKENRSAHSSRDKPMENKDKMSLHWICIRTQHSPPVAKVRITSHLVGLDQPVRERDTMWQQLVDDTAVVLGVRGGVTVEVWGQQSPRLVCGADLAQRIDQLKLCNNFWILNILEGKSQTWTLWCWPLMTADYQLTSSRPRSASPLLQTEAWCICGENGDSVDSSCSCLNICGLTKAGRLTWRSNPQKLEPDSVWTSDRRTRHSQRVHFGPARPPSLQLMRCLHRKRWQLTDCSHL